MSSNEIVQLRSDLEKTKFHLDATAGTQLAMMSALALLLSAHKANPSVVQHLRDERARIHATLLGSKSSDYKIQSFEEAMDSLIQIVE